MDKIASFDDKILTIKTIIYLFLLIKVSAWIGDKIIFSVVLNVFIFYAPINSVFPNFLFYTRMYIKQIIEGIVAILICFCPTCEKKKNSEKEKTN